MHSFRFLSLVIAPLLLVGSCGGDEPTNEPDKQCETDAQCGGATCCGGICANLATSSLHCGACGVACGAGHWCAPAGCTRLRFSSACDTGDAVVVHDDTTTDNNAGDEVGAAIATSCPTTTVTTTDRADPNHVDQVSGAPLGGHGTTYVVAGGAVFHPVARYLRDNDLLPVRLVATGSTVQLIARDTSQVLANDALASLNAARDYAIIQMAYDDATGSRVLNSYGVFETGTRAAAWYFANAVAPNTSNFEGRWLVARWVDGNSDGNFSAGEFTILGAQ